MTGKCPNHGVPLQASNEKHVGICPISGYRFRVAIDETEQEKKFDKFGKPLLNLKVTPLDGEDG